MIMTASAALVLAGSVHASAVNDGEIVCLTNHSSSCMDVKDNHYYFNQPLWLYDISQANAAGFSVVTMFPYVCDGENNSACQGKYRPFTDHVWDALYDGDDADIIYPTPFNDRCVGESGGSVILTGSCISAADTIWVADGNYLINVKRTNTLDAPAYLTAANTNNKTLLTTAGALVGWQQWSIRCSPAGC
jgi:hypothetical protein